MWGQRPSIENLPPFHDDHHVFGSGNGARGPRDAREWTCHSPQEVPRGQALDRPGVQLARRSAGDAGHVVDTGASQAPTEGRIAVGEDTAVGCGDPVAVTARRGGHAHDGAVQVDGSG